MFFLYERQSLSMNSATGSIGTTLLPVAMIGKLWKRSLKEMGSWGE